ncbi:MAG: hypothetical protein KIG63_00030 [Methanobrevibacter sp.]|nr:hypothetical protein [Methanobrevibacter sp.]
MLKKTIKYTDYDGNEREEDFYFNLNKAEVTEMELSKQGGLSEYIKRIVAAQDAPSLVELFKELICKSYGEKSLDGKRFVKSKELTEEFTQTEAYAELFVELASNAEEATKFVNGIMPKNMNIK